MRNQQVICDVCGRMKADTNHWFIVLTRGDSSGIGFAPASAEPYVDHSNNLEHVCGEMCLHVRLTRWIEQRNKPAAPATMEGE
jgi:hypothetical protein